MKPAALVLAGSRPGTDPLAGMEGAPHKALIEIGGRTMLARVCAALEEAGLSRILVSASDANVIAAARELGAEIVTPAQGPSGSVGRAFAVSGAPLLVTTADHALLRPAWVRQMIADTPKGCDVSVMLAEREAVEAAVPGTRRTWLRFADGAWSGCNLFLLATPNAAKAIEVWSDVEANRKRPWKLAAMLGPGTLLDYTLGRLTLAQAVRRLGERMGIRARLIAAKDGLAAVDVDKPEDLVLVRSLVAAQETGRAGG